MPRCTSHLQRIGALFLIPVVVMLFLFAGWSGSGVSRGVPGLLSARGVVSDPVPAGFVPIRLQLPAVSFGDAVSFNTQVVLCKLDFQAHSQRPWETPMFRDLAAPCNAQRTLTRTLGSLNEQFKYAASPTGFIFHQSRVGSTLLSNLLAADPENLVYAESHPPATVALHCSSCSREEKVQYLRAIVHAMANSAQHKRLFFKFQSVQSEVIDLYLEAFPSVPWVYVYRRPEEILASQFRQGPK
jgi:hypothetical protein